MSETPLNSERVAQDLSLPPRGVAAVMALLDDGATVPFIARYRKERTGGLDEVQIRAIEERANYRKDLEERRKTVLQTIESQGKLTDELRQKIEACDSKQVLEDLYLPYKPKRKTKASVARERGLEPLADKIIEQATDESPEAAAQHFVDPAKEVASIEEAIAGACDIVIETVAEHPELRHRGRELMKARGQIRSEATEAKTDDAKTQKKRRKFEDYFEHREPVGKIPSHRILALRRGEAEGVLKVRVEVDAGPIRDSARKLFAPKQTSPYCALLERCIDDGVAKKLLPSVETDVRVDLKLDADRDAVQIFAANLENLLLSPPLGRRPVLGVDPGMRTGSKCVILDDTGKLLEHVTLLTMKSDEELVQAQAIFLALLQRHQPGAIAVGNGTGGREIEKLIRHWMAEVKFDAPVVMVNEAGASVYSASDVAREEFPDLDLTIRGAVSIARRLQDPLAELVKIEPKSIGVGQYQHDVHQGLLQRKLHEVVESCVNRVGVELNTASASLLSYVSGVGPQLAKKIVSHRDASGAFNDRNGLLQVPGMGPKTFEQAAGFLRVRDSKNPLDRSAVHPERYDVVAAMAADCEVAVEELVGNSSRVGDIDITKYESDDLGRPTLLDIIDELKKPGRDPRRAFTAPKFRDDINSIDDLTKDLELEGVVTNVTAFGAFVDIGVHQDGLVHVSQLSNNFVKDPKDAVRVGDTIKVRVLDVDKERKRISLTARSKDAPAPRAGGQRQADAKNDGSRGKRPQKPGRRGGGNDQRGKGGKGSGRGPGNKPKSGFSNNPFANLLKN